MATPVVKLRFEPIGQREAQQGSDQVRQSLMAAAEQANRLHQSMMTLRQGMVGQEQAALRNVQAQQRAAQSARVFEQAMERQDRAVRQAERSQASFADRVRLSGLATEMQARLLQQSNRQLDEHRRRLEATALSSTDLRRAVDDNRFAQDRLNTSLRVARLQEFAAGTGVAGRGAQRMGFAAQNASFQVADFAVQVGGGTSAARAFAQQAPQLAAGFGAIGAAIGAVIAVGAALAPMLLAQRDASDEASDAMDDYRESVRRAAEAAGDIERASRLVTAAKKDEAVAFLEAGLAIEQEALTVLNARIRVLMEQQQAGLTERAGFQMVDLIDVTGGQIDETLARIDNLNNRLALLRDTMAGMTPPTRSAAGATGELGSAQADAIETARRQTEQTRRLLEATQQGSDSLAALNRQLEIERLLRSVGIDLTAQLTEEQMGVVTAVAAEVEARARLERQIEAVEEARRADERAAQQAAQERQRELQAYEREVASTIERIGTCCFEWPAEASEQHNVQAYEEMLL